MKRVSVIIPAKNEGARIHRCLDSLAPLVHEEIVGKIIVVDNGSTDNTIQIAKEYGCSIVSEPTRTVAGLRNAGAQRADTEYLAFLDADMIASEQWLECALGHFKDPNIACVTGLLNIPTDHTWVEHIWTLNRKSPKNVYQVRWAPSGNLIVRNDVFRKVGGFSEYLVSGEDVDFCEKVRNAGYTILYDADVSVIHTGEYKTITEFFRKECWRGYGDLDLMLKPPFHLKNLRHGTQPIYFFITLACTIISIAYGKYKQGTLFALGNLVLPGARTIMVLNKIGQMKFAMPLLIIWYIYYCARSKAIISNIINRMSRLRK